ncbi:STP1 protein [Plasmodium ovale wallikeri]|uniref:STP1 protein n=1 Tax=Plasmodium ovale wallikeri TaxID=864142 RepID=A0A1A9AGV5_PLAOA|nr:STP1 protein [Plasmodium ovale wallikeri]
MKQQECHFCDYVKSDAIKKLIHTYGHKDCGLRHKELCDEIKKIIFDNKKIVFQHMDPPSKKEWSTKWDKQRNGIFNKLFQDEGFVNMCYPFKKIAHQDLYQLLSRHVNFCKEKDKRRSALGENPSYSECVEYNSWIETEKASFYPVFLRNVSDYSHRTVKKYFSTKKHPGGHNPLPTYLHSKLDCNKYNPSSKEHKQKPVDNAPTKILHLPTEPGVRKESQGKDGGSVSDGDGEIKKNKPDVQILQTKASSSDSLASPISNTKVDSTDNGQNSDLKAKDTHFPSKDQVSTGQATETTDARTSSPQQLPESPTPISSKDSSTAKVLNPPSSVVKDQDTGSNVTPSTTSGTSGATHSTQNLPSLSAPDLSLVQPQPQPPPVNPDLGLAPSKAEASSVSGTSSTIGSTTTDSTAGSPPAQEPLLITVSPQLTTTTSIVTTPIHTQTTTAESGPATTAVSVIGTQPIPSISGNAITTKGSENPKAPLKTKSDTQESISVSPKKQDDLTPPSIGAQSPGPPADPLVDIPHGPQLPAPPSIPPFQLPTLSSGVSPDASHVLHTAVTRPDSPNIIASPRDVSPHSKGTTVDSNTPLPKVTYPSEKPNIASTEFPPLINIIPTTLILLATLTILFLLYKYTPFGLFLGRRRRKKKDLRTVFEIPEESTYESPNETIHEWDDHLGRQIMENDVYVKLLKMNRYKKEMQKKKKKRDTTLIEVHMEILEECKNDEWELHKGDFLEICLQEFVNEKNRTAENWRNAELTVNNIKNDKIIQDAEENEILWNFWMGNYRNILESWKSEEWFQNLKNEWKKERQKNHNKIEENTLKESGMISIECSSLIHYSKINIFNAIKI